jgi:hypothetical protein
VIRPDFDSGAGYRYRHRLGVYVFQDFCKRIVELCQEVGLMWGRELYVDATKVEANGGIPSLAPRFSYDAKTHCGDVIAVDPAPTHDEVWPRQSPLRTLCRHPQMAAALDE